MTDIPRPGGFDGRAAAKFVAERGGVVPKPARPKRFVNATSQTARPDGIPVTITTDPPPPVVFTPIDSTTPQQTGHDDAPSEGGPEPGGSGADSGPPENRAPAGPERWPNPRGVKLMAPTQRLDDAEEVAETKRGRYFLALRSVLSEVKKAGIEIVDTEGMSLHERVLQTQVGENYDVLPSPSFSITTQLQLADELSRQGLINVPQTQYLLDTTADEMREMLEEDGGFMATRIDLDRGEGKYFIDRPDQIDTLTRLANDDRTRPLVSMLVVKQFIPSPADHYGTIKVYTPPNAEQIAASLFYSNHTTQDAIHPIITLANQRPTRDPGRILLEDKDSDGFLKAKDVRSMNAGGFRQIPLMGPYAGQLREGEDAILRAYGIDPKHPAVPDTISAQVRGLQPIIRLAGLVSSSDFVVNGYTGEPFYLETNAGPGASPVAVCWLGDPKHPDKYKEMFQRSVRKLVGV